MQPGRQLINKHQKTISEFTAATWAESLPEAWVHGHGLNPVELKFSVKGVLLMVPPYGRSKDRTSVLPPGGELAE